MNGKGSTRMKGNIEGLGHGKRFDTYGGEYRGTWCGGYLHPKSGNFQTGVLVSPRDLELLDLNISLEAVMLSTER